MPTGDVRVFNVSIASAASTSTAIDLGRGYNKVVYDPTGAGGASMFFAAPTATDTYRQIRYEVTSGMSAPQTATVGSALSGSLVEVPALRGLRYVKVAATGTIADGATLKLYCSDI
jgi:hypothetical protein